MERDRNLITQIQLIFWNFIIRLLSQSRSTRTLLRSAARLSSQPALNLFGMWVFAIALAGLASGYLLFYVVLIANTR